MNAKQTPQPTAKAAAPKAAVEIIRDALKAADIAATIRLSAGVRDTAIIVVVESQKG